MRTMLAILVVMALTGCGFLESPHVSKPTHKGVSKLAEPLAGAAEEAAEGVIDVFGGHFLVFWPV